jgi:hypothetical protein
MNANGHLPIEILSAHLDGETTAEERARVESHLAGCEACRATLEDLRRIVEGSAKLGAPELPAGLRERITSSIARPAPRRRAWIGAAASIAAVGLVATAWYLQGPEAPAPQPPPAAVYAPSESDATGLVDAPPPPPPPAPPRGQAKVKAEAKLDAGNVPAREEASQRRARETLPSDEKRGADSGFAMDRDARVTPERAEAVQPMAEVSAPAAMAGVADEPCGMAWFVEVTPEVAVDRVALVEALKREGVPAQATQGGGTIEALFPRKLWPACRAVLAEAGIHVDEGKVRALSGECIGIRVRTPAR